MLSLYDSNKTIFLRCTSKQESRYINQRKYNSNFSIERLNLSSRLRKNKEKKIKIEENKLENKGEEEYKI
jgi:hypothetical protein